MFDLTEGVPFSFSGTVPLWALYALAAAAYPLLGVLTGRLVYRLQPPDAEGAAVAAALMWPVAVVILLGFALCTVTSRLVNPRVRDAAKAAAQPQDSALRLASSDLMSRLDAVRGGADQVKLRDGATEGEKDLAYQVSYLAAILRKHLETGER